MLKRQLMVAFKLARKLGHEWAVVLKWEDLKGIDTDTLRPDTGVVPVSKIQELVEGKRQENDFPGVSAPEVNRNGEVVHTSSTGRIRYTVGVCGDVTIEVRRPTGVVLEVKIPVEGPMSWSAFPKNGTIQLRHLEAAVELVAAVLGSVPISFIRDVPMASESANWKPSAVWAERISEERGGYTHDMYRIRYSNGAESFWLGMASPVCVDSQCLGSESCGGAAKCSRKCEYFKP